MGRGVVRGLLLCICELVGFVERLCTLFFGDMLVYISMRWKAVGIAMMGRQKTIIFGTFNQISFKFSSILCSSPSRVLQETDNPRARADVVDDEDTFVWAARVGVLR